MKAPKNQLRRAFVFGNAAIDEVFQVGELPAAGESVLGKAESVGLGGKGANQAIALARTGLPTTLYTAVGADWHGRKIRETLSQEPRQTTFAERVVHPTDRSIILGAESGDNVIVTTNECASSISFTECVSALDQFRTGDAVLLQGNLHSDVTAELCREARRRDAFLVLNPSPFDAVFLDLIPMADAVFLNETEAHALTGKSNEAAVISLLEAGATQVVLTLGAAGSLLTTGDTVIHLPATPVEVVDVTGAGDCFEGVAVGSALIRGNRIDRASIIHANKAAAQTISAFGAARAFPSSNEIAKLMGDLQDN